MRKGLTISGIVIIILCVLSQLVLPVIASRTVASRLNVLLDTQDVKADISSVPALLLALGHIGSLDVTAEHGRLGKVRIESMHLTGDGVSLDLGELSSGRFAISSADRLELIGVVTEANLEEYLEKSVKKLKNAKVTMTPEGVRATGQLTLLGKAADVSLEGTFEAADEGIYLRTRRVQIKNSRLGRNLNMNLFTDFLIVDVNKIKLPLTADEVVMEKGRAIVRTSYRH